MLKWTIRNKVTNGPKTPHKEWALLREIGGRSSLVLAIPFQGVGGPDLEECRKQEQKTQVTSLEH